MNKFWILFVILSIAMLIFCSPDKINESFFNGGAKAIEFSIKMSAIYAIWLGLFEIAQESGVAKKIQILLQPLTKWLFPDAKKEAAEQISLNITCNLLGLGNAGTVSGITAMKELDNKTGKITRSQSIFACLNTSSLSLLPTTVIALRQSAGSVNPASIYFPTFIGALTGTVVGVVLCMVLIKKDKEKSQ